MSKDEEKYTVHRIEVECAAQVNDDGDARVLLKIEGITPEQAERIAIDLGELLKPMLAKICDPDDEYKHEFIDEVIEGPTYSGGPKGRLN